MIRAGHSRLLIKIFRYAEAVAVRRYQRRVRVIMVSRPWLRENWSEKRFISLNDVAAGNPCMAMPHRKRFVSVANTNLRTDFSDSHILSRRRLLPSLSKRVSTRPAQVTADIKAVRVVLRCLTLP